MAKFLGKRLVQMAFLFFVFLIIIFLLLELQPGSIENQFLGNPEIPPEAREILRERLGLNQPTVEFPQIWEGRLPSFIINFFQADFGVSWEQYPTPVRDILLSRLPRTVVLFLTATLLAYWLGFSTGKLVAWRRNTRTEHAVTVTGIFLWTVFYPWFALLMLWIFAANLDWFPVGKFITTDVWKDSPFTANEVFWRMIWVAVTLGILIWAVFAVTRRVQPDVRIRKRQRYGINIVLVLMALYYFPVVNPDMYPYARDIAWHTVLPTVTLTLVFFAQIMLLTRSSMLETLKEDYILTARAKGIPDKVIRDQHAARNALLPVTTSFVLALAGVIGGGIVTETIFTWEGIGLTLLRAVQNEDIPLAIGGLALIGALSLIGHLVVDILYTFLDPRIRYA